MPAHNTRTRRRRALYAGAALLGLLALAVYARTLPRTVYHGDSGELITAAYQLGVAHPTGYPLYTLAGHLFIRLLPLGSVAWRMNLLSALFAAGAVALFYLLAVRVARSRVAVAAAALLLAFSDTFWSQALVAEVYSLHLLFTAAVLLCALAWDRRSDPRWLRAGAFVWGLSFAHHLMTVLLAPALLYFVLSSPRRGQLRREGRWVVPLFLAPLLLYLYLPWAALRDPPMNWGDPRTLSNFLAHVTGSQYRDRMGVTSAAMLWRNVVAYAGWPVEHGNPGYLLSQFPPSVLWLAPLGLAGLFRRRRRLFGLTLLAYGANVAWSLNDRIPDIEVYYLPSHLVVALWIGAGLRGLATGLARLWRRLRVPRGSRQRLAAAYGAALPFMALLPAMANATLHDRSFDVWHYEMGVALLDRVETNALLIMGEGPWTYAPVYPRYVEGRRPDVTLLTARALVTPRMARLVTRLRARGLVVRVPPGYAADPQRPPVFGLMARLIADNRRRPVYLVGEGMRRLREVPELHAAIPALVPLAAGEPFFRVADGPPPPPGEEAHAADGTHLHSHGARAATGRQHPVPPPLPSAGSRPKGSEGPGGRG